MSRKLSCRGLRLRWITGRGWELHLVPKILPTSNITHRYSLLQRAACGPIAQPGLLGPGVPHAMHGRGHTQGLIQNVSVAMAGISSMPVDGLESEESRHMLTSYLLFSFFFFEHEPHNK